MTPKLHAWERELDGDWDKDFILQGITEGFKIIDDDIADITPNTFTPNSGSAKKFGKLVENQIKDEIANGHYIRVAEKPTIISALSAVEKSDASIRLIHDYSRPLGSAVNDYATKHPFSCDSISDILGHLKPGSYMAKVDLQAAYRSVGLHPSQYTLTGLSWTFSGDADPTVFVDTRLPFGARKSPAIFHRITQSVKRMLERRGIKCFVYLDDFLVLGDNFSDCLAAYNTLLSLVRQLGFKINWQKVCDPTTCLTYLGIEINTSTGILALPPTKASDLCNDIEEFIKRKRVTRRQLESLGGKLQWASTVIPWGRSHTRSVYDVISTLQHPSHKYLIEQYLRNDLHWWLKWLTTGGNSRLIWDNRPERHLVTDASTVGAGAFCPDGDWVYARWDLDFPVIEPHHINVKELASICVAAHRWSSKWRHTRVVVFTDSQVVESIINTGTSHNRMCMSLLKELSLLCLKHDFQISACHISGQSNVIADAISRLHEKNSLAKFTSAVAELYKVYDCCPPVYELADHMSINCLNSLPNGTNGTAEDEPPPRSRHV